MEAANGVVGWVMGFGAGRLRLALSVPSMRMRGGVFVASLCSVVVRRTEEGAPQQPPRERVDGGRFGVVHGDFGGVGVGFFMQPFLSCEGVPPL